MTNPKLRKGQSIFEIYKNTVDDKTNKFSNAMKWELLNDFIKISEPKDWCDEQNFEKNFDLLLKLLNEKRVMIPFSIIQSSKFYHLYF
jgi:hypothetical protein